MSTDFRTRKARLDSDETKWLSAGMHRWPLILACVGAASLASAEFFANQLPPANGGTMRWSKLWVDPSGQGNDLDGDAICYEDFVLNTAATIEHLEWWGDVNPNHGFQIEFWKQDPGTVAYQPYGVFRGQGALPEADFVTTSYSYGSDPTGTLHFTWDLPTPVSLAANGVNNPRWFVAVIGLTDVAYLEWNWAQGLGGSNQTFQFVRGGNEGGGDLYRRLGEGRAMVIAGTPVPEPATLAALAGGLALMLRRRR